MNILDIIFAVPLIWFAYKGFTKGLIIELASLVALLVGLYGAIHFSHITASYIQKHINAGDYIEIIAFVVTFIGIVIAVRFVAKAIEKVANFAALGIINKLAGGVFGFLKAAVIVSFLLFIINKTDKYFTIIPKDVKQESKIYRHIVDLAPSIYNKLEDNYKEHMPKISNKVKI